MESRKRTPRAYFVFRDDIPDGEVVVAVRTKSGDLAFAIRPGEMTDRLLEDLNAAARHIIGVGLVQISENEKPPERKE
ncbi:hypothetical protein ABZZ79_27905 [Streptomyces sp. NPDC006458]|uniref:hypothetical protein n=1 Tax=Streptomyces sp. NPDC006458 TaxID=3154302 RepID=UPI0033A4A44B